MTLRNKRDSASMEALGAALGVSGPTLSRIERGTHAPSVAMALAKWLGWPVEKVIEAAAARVEG